LQLQFLLLLQILERRILIYFNIGHLLKGKY